jgi:hypothetical protein
MSKAIDAARAFRENVGKIDSKNDPMLWNLNQGLGNLALAIEDLDKKIENIASGVRQIKNNLPR